ncbi:MAG: DarT ssDNA thymidine ADP-ribosyltransferase family protein [Planctomycetota bacterium]
MASRPSPSFEINQRYEDSAGIYTVVAIAAKGMRVSIKRADGSLEHAKDASALWAMSRRVASVTRSVQGLIESNASVQGIEMLVPSTVDRPWPSPPDSDEARRIQGLCRRRGIVEVLHFTRASNLPGIVQGGLAPVVTTSSRSDLRCTRNDLLRIDGHLNANCLSLSFPNYRMFYSLRCRNPDVAWVVLSFDVRVLWETPCAFYPTNAASNAMRGLDPAGQAGAMSLEAMFSHDVGHRQAYGLPQNYTTDPQAEVLVFATLRSDLIRSVYTPSTGGVEPGLRAVLRRRNVAIRVADSIFGQRHDWSAWRNPVWEDQY